MKSVSAASGSSQFADQGRVARALGDMTKRAILIGCNYPGTRISLKGCVNDVKRMHGILVHTFGFEGTNIKLMTDLKQDPIKDRPTGANIKRALQQFVAESKDGDVLYLHFSGHGTQVPAESGHDEDDGLDEAICPTDLNLLTDDDFRVLLKPLPAGVAFTFVSDSCHSGGLLDSEEVRIGVADNGKMGHATEKIDESHRAGQVHDVGTASKFVDLETLREILAERTGHEVPVGTIRTTLYDMFGREASPTVKVFVGSVRQRLESGASEQDIFEQYGETGRLAMAYLSSRAEDESVDNDEYFRASQEVEGPLNRSGYANVKPEAEHRLPPGCAVLISGCQSNQTSADANPTGDPKDAHGVLTHHMLKVLEDTRGSVTNADLVNLLRKKLSVKYTQRPCLSCSLEALQMPFICAPVAAAKDSEPASDVQAVSNRLVSYSIVDPA